MNCSIFKSMTAAIVVGSFSMYSAFGQADDGKAGTSKSTITIKTMRIENGDTIITEKHYETEGDGNFEFQNDFGETDDGFFQFKYDMRPALPDTGDMGKIRQEMDELMKSFDFDFDTSFGYNPYHDLFREFRNLEPLLDDSILKYFDSRIFDTVIELTIPDENRKIEVPSGREKFGEKPKQFNRNYEYRHPEKEIFITDEALQGQKRKSGKEVSDFSVSRASDDGLINLSFMLDEKKPSTIVITNAAGEEIAKENIIKGNAMYTRQFDFGRFVPGVYYLKVKQGNKNSRKRIIVK